MALDRVAQAPGDALDELLEVGILEGIETAAAVADRVVVVFPARARGLVAGRAVHVDAAYEAEPRQHVDRAVDARQPDAAPLIAQAVVDGLGAQAALLAREQVQHLVAGAARTVARARELALRVRLPFAASHARSLARTKTRITFSRLLPA